MEAEEEEDGVVGHAQAELDQRVADIQAARIASKTRKLYRESITRFLQFLYCSGRALLSDEFLAGVGTHNIENGKVTKGYILTFLVQPFQTPPIHFRHPELCTLFLRYLLTLKKKECMAVPGNSSVSSHT